MTEQTHHQTATLVLGGTGKTGRRVAERLRARGAPVRIGSRSGEPRFDWYDETTWAPVLLGMGSAYVTYQPDLAFPGAVNRIASFAGLAVTNGVRRLVLLSGRGEEGAVSSEQAVQGSGAEWTILRSSWFFQNFSEDFLLDSLRNGVIALPAEDIAEPFVDADDIADAAVAALTDDRHVGQLYEMTGPRLLTFAAAAAEIAKAAGRQVRYLPVSAEDFGRALLDSGLPADDAAGMTEVFTTVLDGRNAHLGDGVQRSLGRAPRDFADYVRAAAATGVWAVEGRGAA